MKEETRKHILATASELFYSKGYNLTGINEIIDKAGIAKATLYSHFRSKEDICLAYLDLRDEDLLTRIASFCAAKPSGNDQLIGILEFLIDFFHSGSFNGCWCIRTAAEIPRENQRIRDKIKSNKKQFFSFIHNLVISNKQDLTDEEHESLSRKIYLLYEGAVTESFVQQEDWPIREAIASLQLILD